MYDKRLFPFVRVRPPVSEPPPAPFGYRRRFLRFRQPVAATGVPQRNGLVSVPAVSFHAPDCTWPNPMHGAMDSCMSGKVTGCIRPSPLKFFNVLAAAAMFSRDGAWPATFSMAPPNSSIVAQPVSAELFWRLSGAYLFMASM